MLAGLISEHRGPVSADLRRFYGVNLTDVERGHGPPLRDVSDWVANLPPESAVHRATSPDGSWQHNQELETQRAIVHHLGRIAFYTGRRAGYKVDAPELYLFPWEDEDDDAIKGDAMDVEAADDWLGWTDEMREHLNRNT